MRYIKSLNKIALTDIQQVGGKAASLGEMIQAGLPVPQGFVVTTKAYREIHDKQFLKKFEKAMLSEALLGEMIHADLPVSPGFAATAADYKEFYLKQFSEEILEAFKKLGANRVAVRSSAVAEDSSTASWAGQLESYLNITQEELLIAIKKCWQSIDSKRAKLYASQQKVSKEKLAVAVIIQKMVNADASGVLFTTNPVTNNSKEIMIEAGYGLNELLVKGEITPDNYIVAKKTLKIKSKILGSKDKIFAYEDGKNKRILAPEKFRNIFVLNETQIKELVKFGIQLEKYYDKPQDIEWALEEDKFFLVQSRAVTSLTIKSHTKMNNVTWVTAVARRHTPLFLSLVISGEQDPLLIKHQTNLSIMYSRIRRKGLNLQYDKNELNTNRAIVRTKILKYGLTFFDTYSNQCLKSCQEFLKVARSTEKQFSKKSRLLTLKTHLQSYFDAAISHAPHLIVLISVQFELEDFLKKFVIERISNAKQAEQIMNALKIAVEPTQEIANLECLLELGQLVQKKVSDYKEWIIADPEALKVRIAKEFPAVWTSIKHYQKEFCWMGRMYYAGSPITELDIIVRLQNSLQLDCTQRLNKVYADRKRQLAERKQSIVELGGDNEAHLLADIVARYMYLRSYRLNVYFMAHEHAIGLLNKTAEKLGLRGGVDDIIFINWREILEGLDKEQTIEKLRDKIILRKECFEFLSIDGETKWSSPSIKSSSTLKGATACPGIYTGHVRLILNDKAMHDMLPGEVLVTTMTTPSLMLAIEKAGAIVTDEGGMLCHAAIVSREFNIPCLVGTQKATKIFRDGDFVEVDAEKGIVKILKNAA